MITYSVGSSREGGPLDGGSLVDPIVPQHDLTRVGSSYHKVRVELRKTARHHGRLKQTNIWYNSTVSICFLSQFYYCQSHNTFCSQHRKRTILSSITILSLQCLFFLLFKIYNVNINVNCFTWQWKTYSGVVFLNLEFQMRVTPSGSLGESSLAL